jgi:glycine/D-amino acid oxidase-like deaminating enzyme
MMGISMGPITGKLVAEIVSGQAPTVELADLRPDRYG